VSVIASVRAGSGKLLIGAGMDLALLSQIPTNLPVNTPQSLRVDDDPPNSRSAGARSEQLYAVDLASNGPLASRADGFIWAHTSTSHPFVAAME